MLKNVLLLAMFFMTTVVTAQKTSSFDFTFNHLAVSVKDVNAAANFYKDILGLQKITNRTQMDGIRWFSLGEGKELHLVSVIKEKVIINKAVHLALTTPNFDSFINLLNKSKIEYSDWPGTTNKITIRADGIKQIYLQDTDGYWIEINSVATQK